MTRRVLAHRLACSVLGTLLGLFSSPIRADTVLSVGIPAQAVDAALVQFAHQTGLQLVYESHITQARVSQGARAGVTASDALTALLGGTGLSFQFLNDRTVRIFRAEPDVSVAGSTDPAPRRAMHGAAPWSEALSEVVVTGTRYPEPMEYAASVQNIPAAVSMVSGERLEMQALERLTDYADYLPGMNATSGGSVGGTALNLRGIETLMSAATVSFYLDDVPMGPSGPFGSAFEYSLDVLPYDLERLEVWRGPQGTLTGADSFGGLIKYVFKPASLSAFEARLAGDVDTIHGASKPGGSVRAMVNAPIIEDRLALRISAYDDYTPGYIDNIHTGTKDVNVLRRYGAHIATLWRPAESLAVTGSAFWQRIDSASHFDMNAAGVADLPGSGDAYLLKAVGTYGDLTDINAFLQPLKKNVDLYSVRVRWNRGSLEVTSVTGWSRTKTHFENDLTEIFGASYPLLTGGAIPAGLTRFDADQDLDKFSEELRLSAAMGTHILWRVGAFYTYESGTFNQALRAFDNAYQPISFFAPALSFFTGSNTFKERAVFGDLTWRAGEHVDLTGGVRFAHNDQATTYISGGSVGEVDDVPGASSEGVATWMATAQYRVSPQVMLYARAATGSQPGNPNGFLAGIPPAVGAESLTNYETGLKADLLEHRALMNLTVFHMDWKDVQINVPNGGLNFTANVGNAVSQGLELESSYTPVGGLALGYNAAYTQAEFTRVLPEVQYILTGYQLPNTPKWSMSLTVDYGWSLPSDWQAHAGGGFRWIDQQWSLVVQSRSLGGGPSYELPSYSVIDLNAAVAKGRLKLRAFVRNLTDRRASLQTVAESPSSPPIYKILQPRTLGIGLDYSFN
jgi:iron complex outermembrane recepter protein